jgi:CheY-like chemotaxis protein
VGQLAGGIAHDFNNILTAIIGYGNLLLMKLKGDDPLRAYADQILASSERAASVTHSLLAFSRKQIINPKPVRVNDIITRVGKLLARLIGEDVDLGLRLTDLDTTVIADSGQIEQMLMNLATNARDAMPEGGHLSVETDFAELDQTYITTHGYGALGTYLVVSVSDTGVGMDEATRERVFEPFFTTKEVGRGTGLGLSIVYGIVKQHGGYINCYSERGKGTTFKIYLPLLTSGTADRAASAEFAPPKGGTETVLVAEDDKEVRTLVTNILTEFGYTVIEAADGDDAVRQFMDHRETIQLLIIDVIMPRISGKEVYTRIGQVRPGIKALFTSGYTADIVHKKGILEEGTDFITKPIIPQELLMKVREILNR